jgi:hypothetical protein
MLFSPRRSQDWSLHYSGSCLAHVVPDDAWPGMWRIQWPDGRCSDMANRGGSRNRRAWASPSKPPTLPLEITVVEDAPRGLPGASTQSGRCQAAEGVMTKRASLYRWVFNPDDKSTPPLRTLASTRTARSATCT